jgi:hypothetical protein
VKVDDDVHVNIGINFYPVSVIVVLLLLESISFDRIVTSITKVSITCLLI